MRNSKKNTVLAIAQDVLAKNDLGQSTKPAPGLYPHQWLWDSCFVAIGIRWLNVERAKLEIRSLLKGQWDNGTMPHIIFSDEKGYHFGPSKWQSRKFGGPSTLPTSCITQPPMLAEAVFRVGELLPRTERTAWYAETLPSVIAYHDWLYSSRRVGNSPFISLIHPWESGLDNTPYWLNAIRKNTPLKIKALQAVKQEKLLNIARKDTKQVPASERPDPIDLFIFYDYIKQARKCDYKLKGLMSTKIPIIDDLAFNAILLRANDLLIMMAKKINVTIPKQLLQDFVFTKQSVHLLHEDNSYWSRDARNNNLIKEPTIAQFLMLYSGAITKEQASTLVGQLRQKTEWSPFYGIATTPTTSKWYLPKNYWRGPVWVNMNWLIIKGMQNYGYYEDAQVLKKQTLELITQSGVCAEYYSAIDGEPAGSNQFSWTAALAIDMLH